MWADPGGLPADAQAIPQRLLASPELAVTSAARASTVVAFCKITAPGFYSWPIACTNPRQIKIEDEFGISSYGSRNAEIPGLNLKLELSGRLTRLSRGVMSA